jgi:hypothetical protein
MTINVENPGRHRGIFYSRRGKPTQVNLCKTHARELFLLGQFRFLDRYEGKRTQLLEVDQDYSIVVSLMEMLYLYRESQKALASIRAA